MNNLVYLGLSILELSKILKHELWYDYVKSKNCENVRLCYIDTDSFVVYKKTDDIYKDNIEIRFDTWNYKLDRPLPKVKSKKVIGSFKDELKSW